MTAYYNEHDPYAAQWLRNLIAAGHIAPGEVDERSVVDVRADDLRGFRQCHFFAGIGVWSYALRLAGWSDDREVWTGSCPCQPFSAAGKRGGIEDERHLWPEFFRLIRECRPRAVFGEQVASKDGLAWLDIVSADLEGADYACGAVDTCAAGFGAPHIRQRLYFVADADEGRSGRDAGAIPEAQEEAERRVRSVADGAESDCAASSLADMPSERRREARTDSTRPTQRLAERSESDSLADSAHERVNGSWHGGTGRRCEPSNRSELGDTEQSGLQEQRGERRISCGQDGAGSRETVERASAPACRQGDATGNQPTDWLADTDSGRRENKDALAARQQPDGVGPGATNGFWRDADWLPCIDGKARPVEPGTFPLAHGATARVGRLRAYGNAINARQAQEFITAYMT